MSKRKKKGCLHCIWVFCKICLIAFGVLFVLIILTSSSEKTDTDQAAPPSITASPSETPVPTDKPDPANTPEPNAEAFTTRIPGIDGSNAYDPIIDLENKGITKPETVTTEDGILEWTSETVQIDESFVSYQIHANEKHEILDATFNMSGKDNGFLTYAASLPYTDADKEKSVQFVSDHMTGEDASITIGDAVFSIYPNDNGGAMLTINDVDSEAFYSDLLDEKLGL